MTYAEWTALRSKHDQAIARKRSLLMTVRSNAGEIGAYHTGSKARKADKTRAETVANAQKLLDALEIPDVPPQPIGYTVEMADGSYVGFYCSDDLPRVQAECCIAQKMGEIEPGELRFTAKPRHEDRDDFIYT